MLSEWRIHCRAEQQGKFTPLHFTHRGRKLRKADWLSLEIVLRGPGNQTLSLSYQSDEHSELTLFVLLLLSPFLSTVLSTGSTPNNIQFPGPFGFALVLCAPEILAKQQMRMNSARDEPAHLNPHIQNTVPPSTNQFFSVLS